MQQQQQHQEWYYWKRKGTNRAGASARGRQKKKIVHDMKWIWFYIHLFNVDAILRWKLSQSDFCTMWMLKWIACVWEESEKRRQEKNVRFNEIDLSCTIKMRFFFIDSIEIQLMHIYKLQMKMRDINSISLLLNPCSIFFEF